MPARLDDIDTFYQRFDARYGAGALTQVILWLERGMTNANMARRLGFSREYARQVRAQLIKHGLVVQEEKAHASSNRTR